MRTLLLALTAAALGVSSAFLVACGDRNSLIPSDSASAIKSDLDQAGSNNAKQECRAAQADVLRAQAKARKLPAEVDGELRQTLADNIRVVYADVLQQCGKTQTTQSTQTTATTPTTPTETTQTETTTTETQPPTTTTAPPTTTTAPPPTTDSGGTPAGPGGGSGGAGGTP